MSVNGLEKITGRILSDAGEEAERIRSDAQAACEEIASDAKARAEAIKARLTAEAGRNGEAILSRAKSTAAMKKRNLLAQTRSDLVDSVYSGAYRRMLDADRDTYAAFVTGTVCEAITERVMTEEKNRELYGEEDDIRDDFEILLNANDRKALGEKILRDVMQKLDGKVPAERVSGLKLSEKTAEIDGGAILRYGDVETNCSLASVFTQLRRDTEAEVTRTLFGALNEG